MRQLWFALLFALIVLPIIPIRADDPWICVYDFTTSDAGWSPDGTVITTSTRDASGWNDGLVFTRYRGVSIQTSFGATVSITDISVDFERVEGDTIGFTTDAHVIDPGIWALDYESDPTEPLVLSGTWSVSSIGNYSFAGMNNVTSVYCYATSAPTVGTGGFTLGGTARPLHVKIGATGYNVAPWTNTAIFSSIIYDL